MIPEGVPNGPVRATERNEKPASGEQMAQRRRIQGGFFRGALVASNHIFSDDRDEKLNPNKTPKMGKLTQ
jgi:hypothetical protein